MKPEFRQTGQGMMYMKDEKIVEIDDYRLELETGSAISSGLSAGITR